MRKAAPILLVAAVLAALAVGMTAGALSDPVEWTPDGLFYQARSLELRGDDNGDALRETFQGPLGAELRRRDPAHSGDPDWVAYNAKFYERRIAVPLAAAALEPAAGDRAILDISIAGYVATILALFLLLLMRFRLPIAAAVSLATIALPALSHHAAFPLTDTWGLALEIGALAAGLLVLDRGPRWLPAWVACLVVLSFTRDTSLDPDHRRRGPSPPPEVEGYVPPARHRSRGGGAGAARVHRSGPRAAGHDAERHPADARRLVGLRRKPIPGRARGLSPGEWRLRERRGVVLRRVPPRGAGAAAGLHPSPEADPRPTPSCWRARSPLWRWFSLCPSSAPSGSSWSASRWRHSVSRTASSGPSSGRPDWLEQELRFSRRIRSRPEAAPHGGKNGHSGPETGARAGEVT